MNALATTITFNNTNLDIIDRNGQRWLQSPQIAMALGYKQDNAVTKIFNRNADEFTDEMVSFVDLPKLGKQRIFSPRGAHLIAMFARTDKAKAFRKWVLDVLDAVVPVQQEVAIERITPEEKGALHTIMSARCAEIPAEKQGSARSRLWKMINSICGVNSYHEIPRSRFNEVRDTLLNFQPVKLNTYKQEAIEEVRKPFHYPEELAKPSSVVSLNDELITLKILNDERYENPLAALLREHVANGDNINGAEIVYRAMLHIMETQSNTLSNISKKADGGMSRGYRYHMNKKASA